MTDVVRYWEIPQMWTGDCWIIGGGPSLIQQFGIPADVVAKVRTGELPYSTYSSYLAPLHYKNVIGTNVAFMLGEWVSVLYFCDARFFRTHQDAILAFRNIKATCCANIVDPTHNVKRLKRDYALGLSDKPTTICWNQNSGAAAINFATLAGATRIMLLGFDMCAENNTTHWHSVYGKVNTHKNQFNRFLRGFPEIAKQAKKKKIEILNVSPNSAITAFRKVSLKDVL